RADLPVVADAKLFLAEVAEELRSLVTDSQSEMRAKNSDTIATLKKAWLADYEPLFSDDSSPVNGYRMFRELWNAIDPDTTMITHESGASRDIQSVFYQSTVPRSYLGWGQSSQLGFSLGLAMGAKIANADKLVVNVMGDGSAGMTGMDWETAVRERAPIMTVVKHDSIFSGYDRAIPEAVKRYQTSTQTGDYAGVAKALGCHAERVTEPGGLRPAFDRAIRATREGQPAVVDVITAETRKLSRPAEWGSPH
ncbi:MAG: thiamine pyrophosphate-dependent enzyme, partial [Pirellulaceae bacterium]|nr:thiamine pyrophosphate-dependent enzyme [Pirellulaceae bacterium]